MARPSDVVVWVGRSGKRIAVTTIGCTLVGVGLVLLVLPGPGLLLIVAGLAVLATEYAWARSALEHAKRRTRRATGAFRGRRAA